MIPCRHTYPAPSLDPTVTLRPPLPTAEEQAPPPVLDIDGVTVSTADHILTPSPSVIQEHTMVPCPSPILSSAALPIEPVTESTLATPI